MPDLPRPFLEKPVAHRGFHNKEKGRIENSPSAIRAAIMREYAIEIDLQLSADGVPMVFHDYTLDRLTDTSGRINQRTAAQLGTTTYTDSQDFIQTLSATLHQVAGRAPLLLEIKDQDGGMGPNIGPLEEAVADALRNYRGPVAVMSFNPHSVAAFGELMPQVSRGIVTWDYTKRDTPNISPEYARRLTALEDFDRVGADFVSCDRRALDRPVIHALKARGVPILTWTIKSRKQEKKARLIADNVTFEGYKPKKRTAEEL